MAKSRQYEVNTLGNSLITKPHNRIFGISGGRRSCFGKVGLGGRECLGCGSFKVLPYKAGEANHVRKQFPLPTSFLMEQ